MKLRCRKTVHVAMKLPAHVFLSAEANQVESLPPPPNHHAHCSCTLHAAGNHKGSTRLIVLHRANMSHLVLQSASVEDFFHQNETGLASWAFHSLSSSGF